MVGKDKVGKRTTGCVRFTANIVSVVITWRDVVRVIVCYAGSDVARVVVCYADSDVARVIVCYAGSDVARAIECYEGIASCLMQPVTIKLGPYPCEVHTLL